MEEVNRMPTQAGSTEKRLQVTIYLYPILYEGTKIINGYLPEFGEELEPPIIEFWESVIRDCKFVTQAAGFTVKRTNNNELMKPEVVLSFCKDPVVHGTMTVKLRVSDNPFDATFLEACKEIVLKYLNENSILDGIATKAGIDFQVEKVVTAGMTLAFWSDAMFHLYNVMKSI